MSESVRGWADGGRPNEARSVGTDSERPAEPDDERSPGSDGDDTQTDVVATSEVFGLLSDETRLAIVRELAAADEPVRFCVLRERVGAADSGRFNYHLGKLRDTLVVRDEDGYRLTPVGTRVAGTIPLEA